MAEFARVLYWEEVIEPLARPALDTAIAALEVLRLTRPAPIYQQAFDVLRVARRQLDVDAHAKAQTEKGASAADAGPGGS